MISMISKDSQGALFSNSQVSLADSESKSNLLSSLNKVKSRVRFSEDINDSSQNEEM